MHRQPPPCTTASRDHGASDDPLWLRLRAEAQDKLNAEPALGSLYCDIVAAPSFEAALINRLSSKLSGPTMPEAVLAALFTKAAQSDPFIGVAMRADILSVAERDPACIDLLQPFLYFKGYAAIQTYRLYHQLWIDGRRDAALYLQSRSSEVFQTDIHPAARIGKGLFLDHATGFVAGETVLIEDNVSILHGVTLGGTGIEMGERHPKIRSGVLIGAGAQILGNVEIGAYSKIAAGSFVTASVPPRCTAVGVPARIVKGAGAEVPAASMDQHLSDETYESFTYVI